MKAPEIPDGALFWVTWNEPNTNYAGRALWRRSGDKLYLRINEDGNETPDGAQVSELDEDNWVGSSKFTVISDDEACRIEAMLALHPGSFRC